MQHNVKFPDVSDGMMTSKTTSDAHDTRENNVTIDITHRHLQTSIPQIREETHRETAHFASCAMDTLGESELLSLVLRTPGKKGGSALTQAQHLLARFGTLRGVAQAGLGELTDIEGINTAKAVGLSAAFELGKRLLAEKLERGQIFTCSRDVYLAYAPQLRDLEQETFWILLLDQRNRVLRQLQIAKGSINRCPIMPQDIFAPALREKAVRMVLLHNHPSGDPEPSTDDRSLTRRIKHIAELLCIELVDHIVIGDQRYVSFADRGWL